jgi:hypothetical protein
MLCEGLLVFSDRNQHVEESVIAEDALHRADFLIENHFSLPVAFALATEHLFKAMPRIGEADETAPLEALDFIWVFIKDVHFFFLIRVI